MLKLLFGSRLYGTASVNSDYDYHVIGSEFTDADNHYYTYEDWQNGLNQHEIQFLEIYSRYPEPKQLFEFNFNPTLLRKEISFRSNHSFVKAKKKIEVEKDFYIGKKSLFHSLRIIDFGIQFAKNRLITNFKSCNHLYKDIMEEPDEWTILKEKYHPIFRKLSSEFKKLAPRE